MVRLAQGGHHLSFHEFPTAMAACPVHPLVVQGAQILPVLDEEAPLRQVTAAHFAGETFDVEMFGLDPKHFTFARLPTFMAVNDWLLGWVVRVLRVGHFLLHHGNRVLWRAALKESGIKSRSGSAPGQTDPRLQRLRGQAPAASTRQVRGFFLKSRPHLGGPSSGAAPEIAPSSGRALLGGSALGPEPLATAAAAVTNAKFHWPNLWLTPPCIPRAEAQENRAAECSGALAPPGV